MTTARLEQLTLWTIRQQEITLTNDGGQIVTDAGLLTLRDFEKRLGILEELLGAGSSIGWDRLGHTMDVPLGTQLTAHNPVAASTPMVSSIRDFRSSLPELHTCP